KAGRAQRRKLRQRYIGQREQSVRIAEFDIGLAHRRYGLFDLHDDQPDTAAAHQPDSQHAADNPNPDLRTRAGRLARRLFAGLLTRTAARRGDRSLGRRLFKVILERQLIRCSNLERRAAFLTANRLAGVLVIELVLAEAASALGLDHEKAPEVEGQK